MNKIELIYDAEFKGWQIRTILDDVVANDCTVKENDGVDFLNELTRGMIDVRESEKLMSGNRR